MKKLFASFLLISSSLVSAQELHTFSNGEVADADKINENFEALKSEIIGNGGCSVEQDEDSVNISCSDGTTAVLTTNPSAKYSYLEQTPTQDGLIFTKLHAFEEYSYDLTLDGEGGFSGRDTNVNALGSFTGYFKVVATDEPHTKKSAYSCPDGTEPQPVASRMEWSWRSTEGAIHFSSETPNAGRFDCPGSAAGFGLYEGRGIGSFSCITQAFYYGFGYGGENIGYDLSWEAGIPFIDMELAVFKPETNGLPGSNYIEITAPEGCIPAK